MHVATHSNEMVDLVRVLSHADEADDVVKAADTLLDTAKAAYNAYDTIINSNYNSMLYRNASGRLSSLIHRPGVDDTSNLDFFTCEETLKPGKFMEADSTQFSSLDTFLDNPAIDHTSVRSGDLDLLLERVPTGPTALCIGLSLHPLTDEVMNAIVKRGVY